MEINLPKRKSTRLKEYDYSNTGYYFVTICIKNRLPLLGKILNSKLLLSNEGLIVNTYISSISKIYNNIQLDEYVIMPNHIHMILIIHNKEKVTLSSAIQHFKGKVTKELGYSIWQKLFHEHIIRDEKTYYIIKQYIQNNVVNWEEDRYFEIADEHCSPLQKYKKPF